MPAGIRGRGSVFTYTWRDGAGRQYSRKAGDILAQAEAFKRRIDDQLALGTYTPTSTMTFATYATGWIETWPLKDQTRERYRGILSPGAAPAVRRLPAGQDPPAPGPRPGARAERRTAVGQQRPPAHRRPAQLPEGSADRRAPGRAAAARGLRTYQG